MPSIIDKQYYCLQWRINAVTNNQRRAIRMGWPRKIFQSWRGDDNLCELWKYLNIISIFAFFNYCIQNSIQLSKCHSSRQDHNIQLRCSQQHHNLIMYVRATTSYHTYLSDNRSAWYYRNRNKKNNLMTKNLSGAGEQGYSIICARRHNHIACNYDVCSPRI